MTPEELAAQNITIHLVLSTRDPITSCCRLSTLKKQDDGSDVWVTTLPSQSTCKGPKS